MTGKPIFEPLTLEEMRVIRGLARNPALRIKAVTLMDGYRQMRDMAQGFVTEGRADLARKEQALAVAEESLAFCEKALSEVEA